MRAEEFPAIAGDADILELAQARNVEVFHRATRQHIDLAGLERHRSRRGVGNDVPVDLVDMGFALDVVVRVLDQPDERALLPFLEHEGAGANGGLLAGLALKSVPS